MDTSTKKNGTILKRLEWNMACNGSLDPSRYLGRQIRRAILLSVYEEPRTIEEISREVEVPSVIIEDELDEMLYGEAISQSRDSYQANCIVIRKEDDTKVATLLHPVVGKLAAALSAGLAESEQRIREVGFYGSDFEWEHLLWILVPLTIRELTSRSRDRHDVLKTPPFPPRKDGGYGWFSISEKSETTGFDAGRNSFFKENGPVTVHYYWMGRYFVNNLNGILGHVGCSAPEAGYGGLIRSLAGGRPIDDPGGELPFLLENGLAAKSGDGYRFLLPVFSAAQFKALGKTLGDVCAALLPDMEALAFGVVENLRSAVPERLWPQVPGYLGGYLHRTVGMVTEEFLQEGLLDSPYLGDVPYKQVLVVLTDPA